MVSFINNAFSSFVIGGQYVLWFYTHMSQSSFYTDIRRSSQPTAVQRRYIQMGWRRRQQAVLQRHRIQHAHSCLRTWSTTNWRMRRRRLLPWPGRLPSSSCVTSTELTQFTPASVTTCTTMRTRNKACECSNVTTDCAVIKYRKTMLSEYVVYVKCTQHLWAVLAR